MGMGTLALIGAGIMLAYVYFLRMPMYDFVGKKVSGDTYNRFMKYENVAFCTLTGFFGMIGLYEFFIGRGNGNIPLWVPVMTTVLCLVMLAGFHYKKVWVRVWRRIQEPYLKLDKTDLAWRKKMRMNHVRLALEFDHKATWNFLIMAARLLICKPFGHRWSDWENVKYGDFGEGRTCKRCQCQHRKEKGVETFYDGHFSGWDKIRHPDAVFKRKVGV